MTLRYKVEGFTETRDALIWVMLSAPTFKYGLSLDEVFAGLEHGYQSVRPKLTDVERIAQWEESRGKMQAAHALYRQGDDRQGTRTMQLASELFTTLRRAAGRKMSRQELGDSEHGTNEVDE
ncbi:hypothetical protein LJR129_002828 [Acidovorax sp. LjRoot129]|uniref:hypothetical protein n=1 Tax=Acidovorax sp. LjRoot129 TaxID=3342260 RepID=UPI003ECDC2A8